MPLRVSAPPPPAVVPSAPPTTAGRRNSSWLVPALAAGATCALLYRLYRSCAVWTSLGVVTVVYDVRRRSILASSAPALVASTNAPRTVAQRVWRFVFRTGALWRGRLLLKPPGPLYGVFSLPRAVLDSSVGVRIECVVESVPLVDGALRFAISIGFFIEPKELERYLAVTGPQTPHAAIGCVLEKCLRSEVAASKITAAALVDSRSRSTSSSVQRFVERLVGKVRQALALECSVVLRDLQISSVELVQVYDSRTPDAGVVSPRE